MKPRPVFTMEILNMIRECKNTSATRDPDVPGIPASGERNASSEAKTDGKERLHECDVPVSPINVEGNDTAEPQIVMNDKNDDTNVESSVSTEVKAGGKERTHEKAVLRLPNNNSAVPSVGIILVTHRSQRPPKMTPWWQRGCLPMPTVWENRPETPQHSMPVNAKRL